MTKYRVERDESVVWEHETDDYEGSKTFPAEYLNPEEGTYFLFVDDDIIGVQRPYAERAPEEARLAAEQAQRAAEEAARVAQEAAQRAQELNP